MLVRRANVRFKLEELVSKIGQVKSSKNKRFLCIQLIKDHIFSEKNYLTYEWIIFRSDDLQLRRTKVTMNFEKSVKIDFDLSDEVQSIGMPYLYLLIGSTIQIISFLTSKNFL